MGIMEFTDYISPSGIVYSFDADDRFLVSEEGTGMPPIEYIIQKGPMQHGETVIDYRLGTRTIQLIVRQDTYDRYTYWTKRAGLLNAIRPNFHTLNNFGPGTLRKKLPDGSIRDLNVVIEQGPIFVAKSQDQWDEFGYTETLRFIAHDPIYFDPTKITLTFDDLVDPLLPAHTVFPTSFPITLGVTAYAVAKSITYAGSWPTFPKIVITGPMDGFLILNATTGEWIELYYIISTGEIVTIDLPYGNKTIVSSLGTDLSGAYVSGSDITTFHVAQDPEVTGGVNTFQVEVTGTDANSKVELEFYTRYIGI
jgi:hypothetical protein